ncbi:MAG: sigma-70 family RNA polymerase sigma factor [Prevotella sp.]|nr:sigma-70 family RNA polymerase sigma factor [Prevotella sp.]
METELQLLDAIRKGDRGATRRLYERYSGHAMAIGLRYVPERDAVRDVMQDSFVTILTSVSKFNYRGEGSLKAWVSRIVAHKAIDYLRAHERISYVTAIPEQADEQEEPDVGGVPPDVLTEMIGRLPTNYRMVLNLYVFEQRSHREIAQLLGIKENTSTSQYFRAKQLLAKMLNDYLNKNII